jgi:uncharacterized damage-inducible protein DinB
MMNLSTHIAELAGWVTMIMNTDELDFEANKYEPVIVKDNAELMKIFEENLAGALAIVTDDKEALLEKRWVLRMGETILADGSKADMIRHSLSQIIHHRAQLGVYLRLLDIPIPGSYGPSADDTQGM